MIDFRVFNLLSYLPAFIVSVVLGIIILKNNHFSKINIAFSGIVFSLSFWILCNLIADTTTLQNVALITSKLALIGPIVLIPLLYYVSMIFFKETKKIHKKFYFIVFISFILLTLVPTSLNVKNVILQPWGSELNAGILYPIFFTFFIITTLFVSYNFFTHYKLLNNSEKQQLKIILLGLSITTLWLIITNFISVVFGSSRLSVFGPPSIIIFNSFLTYAIIRYRLFDIQIQTQKILNVVLPIVLTMSVVIGTAYVVYNYTNLPRATVGITMVIFTVLLYKASEILVAKTKLNHLLFQTTYRFHQALLQLANKASAITDFEQLVNNIANVFAHQGHIAQFGFVVITDQDQHDYQIYKNTGLPLKQIPLFSKPQLDDWFYHYLLHLSEPLLIDELYYAQPKSLATEGWHELQRQLESLRGGVCIPLKVSHDLVGVIVLGSKERALAYTSEDLAVFTTISTPLAVAVTKSILFTQYSEKITELSLEKNNLQSSMVELHNMKNEFLNIVDHQFNTPLSVIRGAFSMISDGDVPLAEIQDYVKDINPRIEEFHHIVQGMIEAAHFEGGTADMHFAPVALPVILQEVITELQSRLDKHTITLKLNLDSTVQRVTSDPEKLKFAFRHLLENAMFFGAGHPVEIQLTQSPQRDVIVHIRDYGRGFSAEEAKHIGQKFYRGKNTTDFHANGSGLGIYNVRKIISASGGKLTFSSPGIGKGSIFTVTLPKGTEFFKQMSLK